MVADYWLATAEQNLRNSTMPQIRGVVTGPSGSATSRIAENPDAGEQIVMVGETHYGNVRITLRHDSFGARCHIEQMHNDRNGNGWAQNVGEFEFGNQWNFPRRAPEPPRPGNTDIRSHAPTLLAASSAMLNLLSSPNLPGTADQVRAYARTLRQLAEPTRGQLNDERVEMARSRVERVDNAMPARAFSFSSGQWTIENPASAAARVRIIDTVEPPTLDDLADYDDSQASTDR